ncbi:MAG: hypothetical protein LBH60_00095 [Prevotellaceae bacterium]|nr:hypothetical protein [Prevotellaceae bacterium]
MKKNVTTVLTDIKIGKTMTILTKRVLTMIFAASVLLSGDMATAQRKEIKNPDTGVQNRATRYFPHEFSVYANGGLTGINDKSNRGRRKPGFGGGLGFEYTYNFSSRWAIIYGIGLATYSGKTVLSEYTAEYVSDGSDYGLRYDTREYIERQNITLAYMPLKVKYSLPVAAGDTKIFVAAGLKFGHPLKSTTSVAPGAVSTSGHIEYENEKDYDDSPVSRQIRMWAMSMGAIETGIRIPLGYTLALSTGLYLDCGFGSMFDSPPVKRITIFDTGLKVGFIF